ncbi:hypothetical protein CEXT_564891, partial [Caerostris extrusa]
MLHGEKCENCTQQTGKHKHV